ncbi:MAG: complex I NDUFA9 subunit family protein [Hyphomicrobiales bacterium]|nr:complex I NDUFA9 subunit family protein [Hyphomicrobiales bacterium]
MPIRLDSSSLVTIYGGSGFVGRHVVQALARTGVRLRIAVRRPDLAGHLQPLGSVGQIHAVQANLRYPDSVQKAAEGADAVINLVGILYESGNQRFDSIQAEGARAVARAAKKHGATSLVHLSAIGADENSPAHYARSKAIGEKAVGKTFPEAVVLRPSVIFGPEDEFFNRFAAMARMAPALPLIGGGGTRFQPVYVGDVARAVVAALDGRCRPGEIYELGGPDVMTLRDVYEKVLEHSNRRRLLLPLPFGLAKFTAWFFQLLPSPLLTVDQVRLLQSDNVVDRIAVMEKRTFRHMGIEPISADAVIGDYLQRFRPRGEFAPLGG